jgi:hypothetical protein
VRYSAISTELRQQLERVPASSDGACEYRPCRVRLASGEERDFVYVLDAESYIRTWGVWPEDDAGKDSVAIGDVVAIAESPYRLPVELADKLYAAGESGMGYTVFTVVLRDRRRLPYVTGNAVDFPRLPAGVTSADVVDVLPHEDRDVFREREPRAAEGSAPYAWCLYSPA